MTSYLVEVRYKQQPDKWWNGVRYTNAADAETELADLMRRRADDIAEARVTESPLNPNWTGSPRVVSKPKY